MRISSWAQLDLAFKNRNWIENIQYYFYWYKWYFRSIKAPLNPNLFSRSWSATNNFFQIYQDIPYERKLRSLEERRRKDEIDVYLKIRSLIQKKKLDEALAEFEEFKQKNEQCTEIFYTKILTVSNVIRPQHKFDRDLNLDRCLSRLYFLFKYKNFFLLYVPY